MRNTLFSFLLITAAVAQPGLWHETARVTSQPDIRHWLFLETTLIPITSDGIIRFDKSIKDARAVGAEPGAASLAVLNLQQHQLDLRWLDHNGALITRFREPWTTDAALPRAVISGDEQNLFLLYQNGKIKVFDRNGSVRAENRIPEITDNSENQLLARSANAHSVILALTAQNSNSPGQFDTHITIVDADAKTRTIQLFTGMHIQAMYIDPAGNFIAASMHSGVNQYGQIQFQTIVFDRTGKIHYQDFRRSTYLKFANDGYLFSINKYDIDRIDAKNGHRELYFRTNDELILETEIITSDGRLLVLTGGVTEQSFSEGNAWQFDRMKLHIMDTNGKVLQQIDLSGIKTEQPALYYDRQNQKILLGHTNGFIEYELATER